MKRQGVRENLVRYSESKIERVVDKELEIQKLDGKNSTSAKMKVSQLRQDIKDIVAEPEVQADEAQVDQKTDKRGGP